MQSSHLKESLGHKDLTARKALTSLCLVPAHGRETPSFLACVGATSCLLGFSESQGNLA